jgi:hypothetical protein
LPARIADAYGLNALSADAIADFETVASLLLGAKVITIEQ